MQHSLMTSQKKREGKFSIAARKEKGGVLNSPWAPVRKKPLRQKRGTGHFGGEERDGGGSFAPGKSVAKKKPDRTSRKSLSCEERKSSTSSRKKNSHRISQQKFYSKEEKEVDEKPEQREKRKRKKGGFLTGKKKAPGD